jgi:hypothetical protein
MSSTKCHTAHLLSAILAALMILQAAGGFFIAGLYRDNNWIVSAMRANDLVTLLIAVPLLLISLYYTRRGSLTGTTLWLGTLYYALYNNMYYLVGTTFNPFFLIYTAIFAVSAFTLIYGLTSLDLQVITEYCKPKASTKWISGYMFLFAAILCVMWIGQWTVFVLTGTIPQLILDTGGFTHLIAAFDLSMIATPIVLGAIWLLKARPWGFVISAMILIQCTLTCIVLIVTAPFQAAAEVQGAWTMLPLWIGTGVGCLASSLALLKRTCEPRMKIGKG